jgi:hypothetical protein
MKSIAATFILFTCSVNLWAQDDSAEVVMPLNQVSGLRSFTYRLITQEYLANDNGYLLGVKVDTAFVKFTRTEKPMVYRAIKSRSEDKFVPVISQDTFQKMALDIEFQPSGKVKQLVNWKVFRDIFVSSAAGQVRAGIMSSEEFEKYKSEFNNESYVRRLVMEDLNYLFYLCGDTFNTSIEYLRLKTVRSPFSGFDYYFQGNLKLEKPMGSKNTFIFNAQNKAGADEKPKLMEEAQEYLRQTVPEGEPVSEIKGVGLNSEQSIVYNRMQKRITSATLSDVVTLDMSARGNIRTFDFWDAVKE